MFQPLPTTWGHFLGHPEVNIVSLRKSDKVLLRQIKSQREHTESNEAESIHHWINPHRRDPQHHQPSLFLH